MVRGPPLADHADMTDSFRELNHRSHDRIDVALLWRKEDDLVVVTVSDGKTGTEFAIYVREDEQPLDVFHHPFAYAAHRGIDTGGFETAAALSAASA
jgi:hypothetical protein